MHELYAHRGCASCDMVLRHLIAHLDKSSWTNEKKKRGKPQNVNLVIVWESLGKNCLKTFSDFVGICSTAELSGRQFRIGSALTTHNLLVRHCKNMAV